MVQTLISATITGITAFAATNIDDIIVLMLFFSQLNQNFRLRHIVVGQYLGFAVLIIASLLGFLGGYLIPRPWIGLLGLMPILIGFSHLFRKDTDEMVQTVSEQSNSRSLITTILSPQTYQVAAVTIANGGDNIAIYLPLFAGISWIELSVILIIFLVMIAVWCAVANYLAHHPLIAQPLMRYGKRIAPFVLIGLGVYILWESKTYTLLSLAESVDRAYVLLTTLKSIG